MMVGWTERRLIGTVDHPVIGYKAVTRVCSRCGVSYRVGWVSCMVLCRHCWERLDVHADYWRHRRYSDQLRLVDDS